MQLYHFFIRFLFAWACSIIILITRINAVLLHYIVSVEGSLVFYLIDIYYVLFISYPCRSFCRILRLDESFRTHTRSTSYHGFDTEVTNVGSAYNKHDGVFTAPTNGIYVFNWNLYSSYHGDVVSELMVNSNSKGGKRSDSTTVNEDHSSSGCVVVALNHGDIVFIRTHLTSQQNGQIISKPGTYESSFSGWLLYWKLIKIKFCYVHICLTHRIKNIYEIKTNS